MLDFPSLIMKYFHRDYIEFLSAKYFSSLSSHLAIADASKMFLFNVLNASEWVKESGKREKKKNISWSEGNFFMLSWALTEIMVKFLYYFFKMIKVLSFKRRLRHFRFIWRTGIFWQFHNCHKLIHNRILNDFSY